MTLAIILGALVAIIGLVLLARGLRAPVGEPKRAALMIGGTMAAAFGIAIAGFAIAYETAPPLDRDGGER